MKKIKATVKISSIIGYTLGVYTIYALFLMPVLLFRLHFEPWRNFAMQLWSKGMARILNMNITVEGIPPEPPFFLVSNHVSYIDIVVLNSVLKTTFIAKSDVKKWPVVGFMARTMGVIFIDRGRKRDVTRVNKIVSEQLNERQGVILFPEGYTSPGADVLPFRPSLLEHPASENIDVSYAALHYTTGPADEPGFKSVCWWDDDPFYKHFFRMAANTKINATVRFGEKIVKNTNRKHLANELHAEVKKIFRPMVSEDDFDNNYKQAQ